MGPLDGFRIIEIAGIGPGQFCGMLLADMGATVLRVERPSTDGGIEPPVGVNLINRSRRPVVADLKSPQGVELVLTLCESADAIFEGFRPGVMERLGLGPAECAARNRALVYGRMTGWGQDGPRAASAGHDGNYMALAGALAAIGEPDRPPTLPLNLVADFGGGGTYLAIGILAALLEAGRSGQGQVVDAAMTDGVASLMTLFYGLRAGGLWSEARGSNLLDGGAPFYRTYHSSDGLPVVVCALESRFYRELLEILSIDDLAVAAQHDRSAWPGTTARFEATFAARTRDEWCRLFDDSDACFAPVLTMSEAIDDAHNRARGTFVEVDGVMQPAPAPRFSRTVSGVSRPPARAVRPDAALLRDWGVPGDRIGGLVESGAVDP